MEKEQNYQAGVYWGIGILLVLIVLRLVGINAFPDGRVPTVWIGYTIGVLLRMLMKKGRIQALEFLIIPGTLIINYFLFINGIYISNYIVVYVVLPGLIIYYLYKSKSKLLAYKIMVVVILVVGVLSLDYYMYTNRIIKDRNFNNYVKKELGIKGKIEEEDLIDIEELFLSDNDNIISLEGIQHFKNLKKLYLWNGKIIKDFRPLGNLNNLEKLMIWYMDASRLEETSEMTSLRHLEIIYPRKGKIKSLENYPYLRVLEIQGYSFEDLRGLYGPNKLEVLSIGDGQVKSFEGIKKFSNLKELKLYKLDVIDISKVFELENLEKVQIRGGNIQNQERFEKMLRERGILIKIKKLETLEDQIKKELGSNVIVN